MSISICYAQEKAALRALDLPSHPFAPETPANSELHDQVFTSPIKLEQQAALSRIVRSIWEERALNGDTSFKDIEFLQLPRELQEEMYRIANMHNREALVERLNTLGLGNKDAVVIESPLILAPNMDCFAVRTAIRNFLVSLRYKGLLLTTKEAGLPIGGHFGQRKSTVDGKVYYYKGCDIGRLFGSLHIQRLADRVQRGDIKAPRKIIVVHDNTEMLPIFVHPDLNITSPYTQLYSEKVDGRHAKPEELAEVMEFAIAQAGYTDLNPSNLIVTADKTKYFIDTPVEDFATVTCYQRNQDNGLDKSDLAFLKSLFGSQETVPPQFPERNEVFDGLRIQQHRRFGFGCTRKFDFSLKEIFE